MGKPFHPDQLKDVPVATSIDDSAGDKFNCLLKEHKISAPEYIVLKEIMGRSPSLSELGVFSAMWSEHCSYKSSRVHLGRFPTDGENVVLGPGENAGVVRLSGKLAAVFKMESHNHPSYIEPYQGAATGVGGILRDVFCMGARPVANLNCLRFGSKKHAKTAWLLENVVKGIGDYGNCMGIPTVGGNISFDKSYDGNCLVNAMTVGLIHEDRIFKGFASGIGNLVVYVGSATGRDGIHGATMASNSFESAEESERSAVQVGDPFMEKLLLEATLEVLDKDLVVGIQDMGAAGLTSSSFEMADRAGSGLYLNLSNVPQRTTKMSAYELLLSESQERMLMVIKPENWDELARVLEKWQLHYAVIGEVTDTGRMQAVFDGVLELDVPVAPLAASAPKYNREIKPRVIEQNISLFDEDCLAGIEKMGNQSLLNAILHESGDPKTIYSQYDHHIGTSTNQSSREGGAAVQWIKTDIQNDDEPWLGLLSAAACNEKYCRVDPKAGAALAVLKTARAVAAAGGTPLAITDCLNYGNPEVPEVMWDFSQGVDGISEACQALNAPVVSGNVSLYNETDGTSIAPTPMIGMVGKMTDVRLTVPAYFPSSAEEVWLLKPKTSKPTFGGSLVASILNLDATLGKIPDVDFDLELQAMDFLRKASKESWLLAARDIGSGGLLAALIKMADLSELSIEWAAGVKSPSFLFGEWAAAYIVSPSKIGKESAMDFVRQSPNLELVRLGSLVAKKGQVESSNVLNINWSDSRKSYLTSMEF